LFGFVPFFAFWLRYAFTYCTLRLHTVTLPALCGSVCTRYRYALRVADRCFADYAACLRVPLIAARTVRCSWLRSVWITAYTPFDYVDYYVVGLPVTTRVAVYAALLRLPCLPVTLHLRVTFTTFCVAFFVYRALRSRLPAVPLHRVYVLPLRVTRCRYTARPFAFYAALPFLLRLRRYYATLPGCRTVTGHLRTRLHVARSTRYNTHTYRTDLFTVTACVCLDLRCYRCGYGCRSCTPYRGTVTAFVTHTVAALRTTLWMPHTFTPAFVAFTTVVLPVTVTGLHRLLRLRLRLRYAVTGVAPLRCGYVLLRRC